MSSNVSTLGICKNIKPETDELEVAYLVRIDDEGYSYVQCSNNNKEQRAYAMSDVLNQSGIKDRLPIPVLVFYDSNYTPIITNLLMEKINATEESRESEVELTLKQSDRTENRVLNLEAQEEVHLRCGKSEITLRKNGKIIIKGVEVISRAASKNKIRGASVLIN